MLLISLRVETECPSIVIVGGGIAGLAIARTLTLAGIRNIKLLEAQEEVGGRIKTISCANGIAELGAQWFHSSENSLFQIANKCELLSNKTSDEGQGLYFRPNGNAVPSYLVEEVKNEVDRILTVCEKFNTNPQSMSFPKSVGSFLQNEFSNYLNKCQDAPETKQIKKELFDWHVRFQLIDNSCSDLDKLSALAWGRYKLCDQQEHISFKNGYSSLIDNLLCDIPEIVIETSCPVEKICWKLKNDNCCEVICENGQTWKATHVFVTCSIGYLKSNLNLFQPPLPTKHVNALECIGFDTINKIFLEYLDPWWDDVEGIQLVYDSSLGIDDFSDYQMEWTKGITGFDPIENLPGVLLVWVGGEGAVKMETLPEDLVALHCTLVLRKFTGNQQIPFPNSITRSTWNSNKFVRGGYSYISVKADEANFDPVSSLLEPVTKQIDNSLYPCIMFAGEALHPSQFSTTHGAYDSGEFQAIRLLKFLQTANLNVNKTTKAHV